MFLGPIFLLPIVFAGAIIYLFYKRQSATALSGLAFAIISAFVTIWSINQSRSSTAAIGYLFLPSFAALVGVFGLFFGRWFRADDRAKQTAAWICLILAIGFTGWTIREGMQTRSRNSSRDVAYQQFSAEVARHRAEIRTQLAARPGQERTYLDSAIRSRRNDRAFLLAALENDSVSAPLLDTLAHSPDVGITLAALRNRATASSTLTRVYSTHTYPDYFFQAIASHPNTPPEILRRLHKNSGVISNLDVWLAANRSTPKDVLKSIADSSRESYTLGQLIENPSTDCAVLSAVANTLMKRMHKTADDATVARLTERVPEVCPSAKI